jgi:hypothetical protein
MPPLKQSAPNQHAAATQSHQAKQKESNLKPQANEVATVAPLTTDAVALAGQPDGILTWQQLIGNRAVSQLLMRQTAPQAGGGTGKAPVAAKTPSEPKPQDRTIGLDVAGKSTFLGFKMPGIPPVPAPKSTTSADGTLDLYLYQYVAQPTPLVSDWQEIGHLVIKPDLQTAKDQPKVYNYYAVTQQLNALNLKDEELRQVLNVLRTTPEIQAYFTALPESEFIRDASIERVISALPALVTRDIGGGPNDRYEFMHYMRAYLGPDPATFNHFKAIRKANVPGEVYLHDKAAQRLEAVAAELKGRMPASWVGYGLRGRFRTHTRESNSRMAHPLGYAVDYRPYENPMITDPRLTELLDMETGGATQFNSANLGVNFRQRRSLIQQMGQSTADPKQASSFMDNFDKEFKRITEASTKFQDSLTAEVREQLLQLRTQYNTLTDQVSKLDKQIKKAKPEAQPALLEEKNQCLADIEAIKAQFSALFKPWLDKIAARKLDIEAKVPNVTQFPATRKELEKQIQAAQKEVNAQTQQQKQLAKKKDTPPQALPTVEEALGLATTHLKELQQMLKDYGQRERWDLLTQLETSLTTDPAFVFAKDVRNPGVVQLLDKGFFTPDAGPAADEKFNPNKHGFNLAFMRAMIQHGFDQGIAWSPGSVDPMHFELVEGVDSLPTPDATALQLTEARQKISPKR